MKPDGSILITGTSKGLGLAMAEHFVEKGFNVAGCSRSESSIEHSNYRHFSLDLSDESAVANMIRTVHREDGLDTLINNAGIASMNHLLITPMSKVNEIMALNYSAAFLCTREAGKCMQRSNRGRIINLTTVAVPLNLEGESVYASSKAALESLTRISARELAPFNITVNAVGPGPADTNLIKEVPKDKIENLLAKQAIKRMTTPADVIHVIEFLMQEKSAFITGQVLYLGGIC